MIDLISKSAAQAINVLPKCYRNYQTDNLDDAYEKGWEDALFSLNALPTVDPVKHGKWIRTSPTAWKWTCSCCKKDDAYAYSAGESFEPDVLQDLFCPNCGAKMDGGEG